ncbi:MAG: bifunctional riboflavin kinase/FAD synthetase [Cytophagales bacterium]|nr:bifunctional riboflavin kinase/FAD synthetase [Cytophagales bacterium]MDW8384974.1 bifunctional riboflavin kinase/FAD synthetase [Flammeovirgaceae bacterium]
MKVYYHLEEFPKVHRAVVTSGTFDGVHLGHQRILQKLCTLANEVGGQTVVLTYYPHPRYVLFPEKTHELKLLHTLEEKIIHLSKHNIQHLIILPFTYELSQMSSHDFIQKILVNALQTYKLVIGYDHRFGKNREGSFEYLQKNAHLFGFSVEEIPRYDIEHVAVSSTKIRQALAQGNVEIAKQFLGYAYHLSGIVVKGDQLGRTIGFPTANLSVQDPTKLIPGDGIYAVTVTIENTHYHGMCYLGKRSSLTDNSHRIELHIFDFDDNIYGKQVTVFFQNYLRGEMRFSSLQEMKAQLLEDKQKALALLS